MNYCTQTQLRQFVRWNGDPKAFPFPIESYNGELKKITECVANLGTTKPGCGRPLTEHHWATVPAHGDDPFGERITATKILLCWGDVLVGSLPGELPHWTRYSAADFERFWWEHP